MKIASVSKPRFAVLTALSLSLLGLPCQPRCAAEPPPDPPLVGTAPDPSAWVITVQQKKPLDPPPTEPRAAAAYARASQGMSRIVRVEVVKSGKNRREVTLFENKKQGTLFVHDGWVIFQPPNWPADQAMVLPINDRASPIQGGIKSDFTELDWLRPEAYVGRQSYHGQACYYYEDKKHAALTGSDPMAVQAPGVRAWIDVNSRLPVALEDAAVLKTYAYRQTDIDVELTGVFAKAFKDKMQTMETDSAPKRGHR